MTDVPNDGLRRLAADNRSEFSRELRRAGRSMVAAKWPLLALLILFVVAFVAIFGPMISPMDPNRQNIMLRLAEPFRINAATRAVVHLELIKNPT